MEKTEKAVKKLLKAADDAEKAGLNWKSAIDSLADGDVKNSMRNGEGITHYVDGLIYIGSYINDKRYTNISRAVKTYWQKIDKITKYNSSLPEYQSPWWEEPAQGGN